MKLKALLLVAALLAWASPPAFAQTFTHNTTTLSAAQGASDTTASLTSAAAATGSSFGAVQVGQIIFVDQEPELITAIASTTATVQRRGRPTSHASGAQVFIGPGNSFQKADPALGTCTAANQPAYWINAGNGNIWKCSAGTWGLIAPANIAGEIYPVLNTAVASASTIAPLLGVTHITGTTGIATITPPVGCAPVCQITLIPDGLWSTTNAGNIYIATTGVVSKALILTYDGTKWSPSY